MYVLTTIWKNYYPASKSPIPVPPRALGTCQKLAGGGGRGVKTEGGSQKGRRGRGHEKWAVQRGRVMQICVRDHVEIHP